MQLTFKFWAWIVIQIVLCLILIVAYTFADMAFKSNNQRKVLKALAVMIICSILIILVTIAGVLFV